MYMTSLLKTVSSADTLVSFVQNVTKVDVARIKNFKILMNKEKCQKCHVKSCRGEGYCNAPIKEYCPSLTHFIPEPKTYARDFSHSHCWNQGGSPACGQSLESHKQCCLCDTVFPEPTMSEEDCCGECRMKDSGAPDETQYHCINTKCKYCHLESSMSEEWEEEFRKYFDKTLKPKKQTIKNLDREIIIDFIRKLLLKAEERGREQAQWESPCSGCGIHPSFWKTIVESSEWEKWEKVANEKGFDYDESREINAFSPKHCKAFFDFIRLEENARCISIARNQQANYNGPGKIVLQDFINNAKMK